MPFTSGTRATISLMRRASVSHCSTVIALEPTRITSSTSSRAIFFSSGIASATSPACRRPEGVLAIVPPVATTLMRGSLSCACAAAMPASNERKARRRIMEFGLRPRINSGSVPESLPGAVIDRVLVGGAGRHEAPVARPLVGVLEALAGVGFGGRVEDAREPQVLHLQQAARFLDEVVRILLRILLDRPRRLGLRFEHLAQRRAVELLARRFASGRVRLHQHAHAMLLRDADPRLHQADRGDFAALQRLDALAHGAGEGGLDLLPLEEAVEQLE